MKARSLTIGAALAAATALSAATPAAAESDVFTQIFSAIGLTTPDSDPIEYRERAPLVVPPKTQLPAPQASAGQRNSAWPTDPDLVARRKAQADRNAPAPTVRQLEDPEMTPGQLRAGPRTASNRYQGQPLGAQLENDASTLMINPTRQMQQADQARSAAINNLRPGEEPQRRNLSEPPRGYRKPTEVVRAKADPVKEVDSSKPVDFLQDQRRN